MQHIKAYHEYYANILILGNSGQGKSYLLKLILTNLRESGMNICALDPEMEYEDLTTNLGGCFIATGAPPRFPGGGMMPYFDKNGTEIKGGMCLMMGFSQPEKVYATVDADGNPDLGINASNEAYLHRHYPGCEEAYREFYPLSSFNLRDAEICEPEQEQGAQGLSM